MIVTITNGQRKISADLHRHIRYYRGAERGEWMFDDVKLNGKDSCEQDLLPDERDDLIAKYCTVMQRVYGRG